jgi:protein-S-isoprenylcysteine O-methyltransferase Ste14
MASRAFVWAGGALFVASLAYCAWWYLFVLSAARAAVSWSALGVDLLLVGVFALHHSVLARERVKARVSRLVPEALVRSVYVWTASALFILVCAWWLPIGGELYDDGGGWLAFVHAAVQLYGIWLIGQSVRGIDPLELAGIRRETARGPLQIGGPYALVRHPLYFGWVLAVFGAAHMTGDRFAFAVVTTLYLVIAVPWEERSLMRSFGDDYLRYTRVVRWRIVPFIY